MPLVSMNEHGPLGPAVRRVFDAVAHMDLAVHAYNEPTEFRRHVDACIQELRNVTFLLQSFKSVIPGFEEWYPQWQEWMRSNAILRWLVGARNQVVKQSDLTATSTIKARAICSFIKAEHVTIRRPLNPARDGLALALEVREEILLSKRLPPYGVIEIERRWGVQELQSLELISALYYAAQCLLYLLLDCYHRLLSPAVEITHTVRELQERVSQWDPRRFEPTVERRTVRVGIESGQPMYVAPRTQKIEPDAAAVREHYGFVPERIPEGAPLREIAMHMMGIARRFMQRDGYALPFAFLFREGQVVDVIGMYFREQGDKYLLWQDVASRVAKHSADAVVTVAEAWTAPRASCGPHGRPSESLERIEVLDVSAVSQSGEEIHLSARIGRVGDAAILGPTQIEDAVANHLDAVRDVWKQRRSVVR